MPADQIRRLAPSADALYCEEFAVYPRTVYLRKLHRDYGSDWAITRTVRITRTEAKAQFKARKADGWIEI